MNMFRSNRGFTLLEILIVVSIIAILSSIAFVGFDDNRQNAANKAMMAEFKEVQVALELYKAQNDTKTYPLPETAGACGTASILLRTSTDNACATDYIVGLVPDFIPELPSSNMSENSSCDIVYRTDGGGSWYKLTAENCIAGGEQISIDSELARCPSSCTNCSGTTMDATYQASGDFAKSFAVYSQNGQCQ